jgi:hypothetical protein
VVVMMTMMNIFEDYRDQMMWEVDGDGDNGDDGDDGDGSNCKW